MLKIILIIISCVGVALTDFYVGMFEKGDFLVARDYVYKENSESGRTVAEYGREFGCPITYFRIEDRVISGRPPIIRVVRGGLNENNVVIQIRAIGPDPIYCVITVGCHNPKNDRATRVEPGAAVGGNSTNSTGTDGGITENEATDAEGVTSMEDDTGVATTPDDGAANADAGDATVTEPTP